MKKLLIALMSVASFALMAKAETAALTAATGTSFESDPAGEFTPSGDYWATAEEAVGEIATEGVSEITDRPEMFLNETQAQYLKVSTADGVTRYAQTDGSAVEIGGGVYFDSLVQFTAADKARTLATGDKLAIWLKAGEEETDPATLMVSAGVVAEGAVSATQKDYAVTTIGGEEAAIEAGSWHRLTVKSINNVLKDSAADPIVGLVVFIDGAVAAVEGTGLVATELTLTANDWFVKNALIPSFSGEQTFSEAKIVGEGAVDDLSFTPNAPEFAADKKYFTLNWDKDAFVSLSINEEELDNDGTENFVFTGANDDNVFVLTYTLKTTDPFAVTGVTCSEGVSYVGGTFTATDTAEATIGTQIQRFKVGDEYFDDINAAIEAANGDPVQLNADYERDVALVVENQTLVLDLAGHDIVISDEENDLAIWATGGDSDLTIIDSVGDGRVVNEKPGSEGYPTVYSEGKLTIGAETGDKGATFDGPVAADGELVIVGGKFLDETCGKPEEGILAEGSTVSEEVDEGGYWVVTPGDTPEGIKLSWNKNETKMTVLVFIDGYDVAESPAEVETGDVAEFIVLPKAGYVYATEPEGWFLRQDGGITNIIEIGEESVEVTIPEPTAIPATDVQISLPAATEGVAGYIVSNVTDGVAIPMEQGEQLGGATYTLPLGVEIEIWVVPADGYRVTGNPYTIDEVTTGTKVEVTDLPSVAAIVYVAQIGDKRFETLQEAFASEESGDIVLLDNVTLTETISVNKDFVLDLGGKTLTSTLASVGWALRLGDTAAVTAVISNGTIIANQYGVRANQTDLTLDTVTIESTLRALQSTTASDIDLVGCTISAAPNAEDEIAVLTKGGTLDLVDTTVNSGAKGLDLGGTVATIDADSVISVDGANCAVFVGSDAGVKTQLTVAGKIEATASHTSDNDSIYAISGNGTDEIGADVTISEGADISVTADETAIYWPNAGTLTVNGGSITGGTAIWAKSGNVVVNGGEISANGAAAPYAEDNDGVTPTGDAIVFEKLSGAATGYPNNLTASITGGTISSAYGKAVVSVAREGETALAGFVSGGTFSSAIPEEFCASGFIPKANGDGTYGVKEGAYVAKIGDVKFETLQAAIDAAETDDKVTLLADVSEKITIAAGKQLTLDLNEKTLTGTDANYVINNFGTLVITGDGVVDSTAVSHNTLIRNGETGVMTIENGTFKSARITVKNDENGKGVCGVLTINGGTFLASSEQGTEVWDSVQNWGVATINGGEFDGYIECRAESNWNAGVMTITGGTFQKPVQTVVVFDSTQTAADNAADVALTIEGGIFNDMVMRVADVKAKAGEAENVRVDFDELMPEYVASCKTLGTVTIPGKVDDELNPAVFANDESVYCEDGYKTKDLGDGKYGVEEIVYVAQVGEDKYETLADAVTAAAAEQTITLLADIEQTASIDLTDKELTFDLGGKTLTFNGCKGFFFNGVDGAITNGTIVMNVPAGGTYAAIEFMDADGLVKDVVINSGNAKDGVCCSSAGDDFNNKTVVCENVDVTGAGRNFYAETAAMTLDADCSATQVGAYTGDPAYSTALAAGWLGRLTVDGGTYTAAANVVGTMSSPATITLNAGTYSGNFNYVPVSEGYKEMGDHHITKYETIELAAPAGYEWDEPDEDGMQLLIEEVPTYAITWTDPKNAVVVAIDEDGDAVESGDEYSEGCEIVFTVTPNENFTYAGVELGTAWTLLESGAISNLVTMGAEPVAVTIPEAVAAAPAWDIPGANGGIKALVKEDGVTKYVEFSSVDFSGENPTVGLKAAKIAATDELFGLICKTDLTKDDTFVINASLSVPDGSDATEGLFTITEVDLGVLPQLFVVGVGPAVEEANR